MTFGLNSTIVWRVIREIPIENDARSWLKIILSTVREEKIIRSVAQSGSASGLGPEGRRFESCRSDQSGV